MNDKIREDFEKAYSESAIGWTPDFRRYDKSGDYMQPTTYWAWWAWQASRESLVVELPKIVDKEWACTLAECSAMRDAVGMCKKRIESLGLRVKP